MKKTILLVDDSMPMLFLLEAVLGKEYAIVTAQDGLVAMSWLMNGNKPDLIVTDLQMPNIDGWELLNYISGSYLFQDTPVLVLSGFYKETTGDLHLKCPNVREVIQKPFDPTKLMQKIGYLLSGTLSVSA